MKKNNMSQIKVKKEKLKKVDCPGGNIFHILNFKDQSYSNFGEAYFSWIESSYIKGWKKHNNMTCNLVVPVGKVKFVFFDSNYQFMSEELIGKDNYCRLTIPPNIWFAFQGISEKSSLILNIANLKHDEGEVLRLPLSSFDYKWG